MNTSPSGTRFTSINPATEAIIATYETATPEQVEKAVKRAHRAFGKWRETSFKERAAALKAIAAQLRTDKYKLAKTAALEMGKPLQQGLNEVEKCAVTFEYYAKNGARMLRDEMVKTEARKSYVSYQPLGVVLAVMPWNFPYWQVFRCMAPVLMAGNTLLLKHASNVSGCALAIADVLRKAGLSKRVFQNLLLPSSEIAALIAHPLVNAVTLTGSETAGRNVAAAAGQHLKKQVLELGGSDAYIILQDADLDAAVKTCVNARLINSGQSCIAAKRFIVVKSLRKNFERKMTALMQDITYGDPMDTSNRMGPMAREDLRDQLHDQVVRSIEKGAKLLCGGVIPGIRGAYYPATVLTKVKPGMPAYEEELFGPVAAIIEAKDEADAFRIANDTTFGLGGAVFSADHKRAEKLAAKALQAGSCFVNAAVHSDARLPFGGIKNSGYGRELGSFGIREFTNVKTVFVQ